MTTKAPKGSELSELSQKSFAPLLDAFDPGLAERQRRALKVWVALHGIVMLARQGLLRNGVTAAALDELIEQRAISEIGDLLIDINRPWRYPVKAQSGSTGPSDGVGGSGFAIRENGPSAGSY